MALLIAQGSDIRAAKEEFLARRDELRSRTAHLANLQRVLEEELGHAFVQGWEACQRFWREKK